MLSSLHHAGVKPVELLAGDGECASHALEGLFHILVHQFNGLLVIRFSRVDGGDNTLSIGTVKRDISEFLVKTELNVSSLEIVVIDLYLASERLVSGVDLPRGLPFAAPESSKVGVDAADVNLQLTILVETKTGTCGSISVVTADVLIDSTLHISPAM